MFIGHFGVALAAKRVAPKTSLGTLILAAQFLDFLWPVFVLLGIEHVRIAPGYTRVSPLDFTDYPISHSLLMAIVWAILFGGTYYILRRTAQSALVVVGTAVLSHWLLNFIVHLQTFSCIRAARFESTLGCGTRGRPRSPSKSCSSAPDGGVTSVAQVRAITPGRYAFWAMIAFSSLVGSAVYSPAPRRT